MTDDLVAFLRARLDDDERGANLASPGPWHLNPEQDEVWAVDDIEVATAFALSSNQQRNTARHIARHDPARVLREVEAKRRIIEQHPCDDDGFCGDGIGLVGCKWAWPCPTVRLLALPYADYSDYREEWRP